MTNLETVVSLAAEHGCRRTGDGPLAGYFQGSASDDEFRAFRDAYVALKCGYVGGGPTSVELYSDGKTVAIDFWPRGDANPNRVKVCLMDTRAADNLVVEYDFSRDGWVIRMDKTREGIGHMETVEELAEVAFVPAWNEVEG